MRLKKRNEDLAQQKHVQQMEREMKLKAAREKAQREKEERKKKLDMTKTHILHERRQMVRVANALLAKTLTYSNVGSGNQRLR